MKPTAKIKLNPDGKTLFMIINNQEYTAWAIKEDEVEAIRDACEVWLEEESQKMLLDSIEK